MEALLNCSFYLRRTVDTYRHNKIRSTDCLTNSVCSAGPAQLDCTNVGAHERTNLRIATKPRPIRNSDKRVPLREGGKETHIGPTRLDIPPLREDDCHRQLS
jgi:hypothetical protein